MDGKNPCDVCRNKGNCFDMKCPMNEWTAVNYECLNQECMLNHGGACLVGMYERCGAWE